MANQTKPTPEQIDRLLAYLPIFETPECDFGKEREHRYSKNIFEYRGWEHPPYVYRFFELASQPCFTDYEYSKEMAQAWLDDPDFFDNATLEQLISLLTYCNRGEHFADGFWNFSLTNGYIQRILRRMKVLRDAMEG